VSAAADGQAGMDTFRRAIAETEVAFTAVQQHGAGAEERASAVVEALVSHLKSGDGLLVPVLGSRPSAWSRAQTAVVIAIVALRIGMELDYTHPELTHLGQAALLFELAVASRPGAEDGVRLIRALGPACASVANTVLEARERGAPADPDAQIVAVAATYAHLSRELPAARRTWPPAAVKEILRRERARFGDAVLKALIHISVQFPVGGFVRLNSGELARVVAKNDGLPLRPVVVIAGRRGGAAAEPKRVDLAANPFLFVLEFLGHEAPDSDTESRSS
jgi:hypothetical protein